MSNVFADVKRMIARSGMSAWNVANKAGCSEQTIHNWLSGRVTEPHLPTLIRVAQVFGKSVELANGDIRMVDTPATVAAKAGRAREFIGLWRRYQ